MKKGIHPEYQDTEVKCSCGNAFTVKSTKKDLHLEVCNECHPFYKGGSASAGVSKAGRVEKCVEKFNRKYGFNKEAK